jgi:hypothetical protein
MDRPKLDRTHPHDGDSKLHCIFDWQQRMDRRRSETFLRDGLGSHHRWRVDVIVLITGLKASRAGNWMDVFSALSFRTCPGLPFRYHHQITLSIQSITRSVWMVFVSRSVVCVLSQV